MFISCLGLSMDITPLVLVVFLAVFVVLLSLSAVCVCVCVVGQRRCCAQRGVVRPSPFLGRQHGQVQNNKQTSSFLPSFKIHFSSEQQLRTLPMENEYESLRESNIERNKKFLKEIGLESNTMRETHTLAVGNSAKLQKKKRKFPTPTIEQQVNSRRSLRIATLPVPSYKVLPGVAD